MDSRKVSSYCLMILLPAVLLSQGCSPITGRRSSIAKNAIPAGHLPLQMTAPVKGKLVPVEWTRLRRPPVREHVIGAEDLLGIYVDEVLPAETTPPAVFFPGQQESPSVGQPMKVRADGSVFLPLVGPIQVTGLTLPQATEKVRQAYVDKEVLKEDQFVNVELIKARTVKVFVVRDDTDAATVQSTERRKTMALDLPVFENDVLHALSASGGLPSEDAFNELWILRGATVSESQTLDIPSNIDQLISENDPIPGVSEITRIPLLVCPGQALPFLPEDVVLNDGDVVYIERRIEFFVTGGLIQGGQHLLPRDEDLDIIEAMSIAGNNAFGPVGQGIGNNFRGGPGAIIPPSSVIIVRKLESGEQIKIAVDVRAALNDPSERVTIQDRDVIILQYRPHELAGNMAINILRLNFLFNDGTFGVN
jgi:protein involved in polysaccharide export with SLBB domain